MARWPHELDFLKSGAVVLRVFEPSLPPTAPTVVYSKWLKN